MQSNISTISSPLEGERMSAREQSERRANRGGYSPLTLGHAKNMRKHMQDAEYLLWCRLSRKQLGVKFRRQQPIGAYVADFFCPEKKLIVELDGSQHQLQQSHDAKRTAFLESEGYSVMRFWNNDVFVAMDSVLEKIIDFLHTPHASSSACGSLSAAPPQGGSL